MTPRRHPERAIHWKKREEYHYKTTQCGLNGWTHGVQSTRHIEQVTCKTCMRSIIAELHRSQRLLEKRRRAREKKSHASAESLLHT